MFIAYYNQNHNMYGFSKKYSVSHISLEIRCQTKEVEDEDKTLESDENDYDNKDGDSASDLS